MKLVPYSERGPHGRLFCLSVREGDIPLTLEDLQGMCVEAVAKVPGLEMVIPVSRGYGFISFDVVPHTATHLLQQFVAELNMNLAARVAKEVVAV